MPITIVNDKSSTMNKASVACPACRKPVQLATRGDRAELPNFCTNCGAQLALTASGGGQAAAAPEPDNDQVAEKSAAIDFTRMDRDQIAMMARTVAGAVAKAAPRATPAEQLAAIDKAAPGLLAAHSATVAQLTTTSVAKQTRVIDARASVVKAIEAGAEDLVRKGAARTREQAIALMLKRDPSLYERYRDAGQR
jgi:hypothetical protein